MGNFICTRTVFPDSSLVTSVPPILLPRPFLKWAGGKGQLISQYLPYFPDSFETYYEPFLGGGAVFFRLQPARSVLMDINDELVNVYRCVRDRVMDVIALLEEHQLHHSQDYYYWVRSNPGTTDVERAARLIYLNRTCFNGLYRENSRGQFNVPIGRYKNPKICHADLLQAAAIALRHAELLAHPFEMVLEYAHTPQDFVYLDPPYYPISATSRFTSYNRYAFNRDDQIRLRDVFAELARRGVKAMLSNSDCEFIRDLYADFPTHTITAARSINSNARRRGKITEVLVTSYR